jgi:uncharacterized membrane protein
MDYKKINSKNVSVRYNTNSDGKTYCWRVVCDGVEYLTNKIDIEAPVTTSKDWMGENVGFKHHVTMQNACVNYSVDYTLIQTLNKSIYRDILKTISYRIFGTSVTFGIGYLSTGNLSIATALGFSDLILKPIVYFIHERLWRLAKN